MDCIVNAAEKFDCTRNCVLDRTLETDIKLNCLGSKSWMGSSSFGAFSSLFGSLKIYVCDDNTAGAIFGEGITACPADTARCA